MNPWPLACHIRHGDPIQADTAVHLRPWLRAQGFTPSELRRMLRTGDLRAVRPGAYVAGGLPDEAELPDF